MTASDILNGRSLMSLPRSVKITVPRTSAPVPAWLTVLAAAPKHPIVLAHGLCGFDEIRVAGTLVPAVAYWRGITDALRLNGIRVITTSVPPFASIEERAARLGQQIAARAPETRVNIIAHSMGGLDARYMVAHRPPGAARVVSLTTVGTPHAGSTLADTLLDAGAAYIPGLCRALGGLGIPTGAFVQLTRRYMTEEFNPATPDVPDVQYYSYGARIQPGVLNVFRLPHGVIDRREGPNDGLVSVKSSKWGCYKGTLVDVSHLDLINWSSQLRYFMLKVKGSRQNFNAIAFYLGIADMLAKEGL
ncbi:hypothetical protein K3495_g12866 [Podosphaera aphanis]|nr:hypothetical protein K3495_g12866 [Podosphaera aphanis]